MITLLTICLALSGRSDSLLHGTTLHLFQEAMHLSSLGQYTAAESLAQKGELATSPEGKVLEAVVDLAHFADLHDLDALERARKALAASEASLQSKSSARERFLLAMTFSQASYLANLEERNLSAVLSGRKAANLCEELIQEGYTSPDLHGILGGYLFWKAQSLGTIRFALGGDTRDNGIEWTQQAVTAAGPFQEAYRTSLMWIRFERKEFVQGLALARAGLAAAPGNRLYRQAEGDMLFRLKRLPEALDTYRASWTEYAGLEKIPANRLAAAGNLVRIHEASGQADSARAWLDTLDAPRYTYVRKWLPPSLVRELEPIRKRLGRK